MRSFTASTVILALAALPSVFAAPLSSIQPPAGGKLVGCPITGTPDLPTNQTLLAVTTGLKPQFVGLGMGVQNYTCSAAGTYVSAGAVATLLDASCFVNTPLFTKLPSLASAVSQRSAATASIAKLIGKSPFTLGNHFFVGNAAGGISPEFDFTASQKSATDFVIAAKTGNLASPAGKTNVDWLMLNKVSGGIGTQVFRVDTNGGQPPASCTPGSALISVPYAANYWFMA